MKDAINVNVITMYERKKMCLKRDLVYTVDLFAFQKECGTFLLQLQHNC